ncbi:hypothetical protein DIPPA_06885 [Diplonema papillatum]|nr:hypothetical protein DIPPA_06885 [Diplonema papillatum]
MGRMHAGMEVKTSCVESTRGAAAVPDVDFSLRTNFRTLRGLLRPKLEETLRGIIIHLPEGTVEVGPEKSPVGSPVSSKSGYHDRAAALPRFRTPGFSRVGVSARGPCTKSGH